MFDGATATAPGVARSAPTGPLRASTISAWATTLTSALDTGAGPADDAARIDAIEALERLKATAAAAQARLTAEFAASQRADQSTRRVRAGRLGQGIAAQVALARRESPTRGARHVGLATVLVDEMPHALAALAAGRLSEWQVTLLARETACLTLADRREVDRRLCADPATTEGWGDRRLVAETQKIAYRCDPEAAVRRARRAEADRHVSLRPAPDTMTYLTALLPVADGVAAWAALGREADRCRAAGDPRGRGQVMADALVQRVTGQRPGEIGVEVQLVMTDRTLLRGDAEPAHLTGYGTVPAGWARDLVRRTGASPDRTSRTRGDRAGTASATAADRRPTEGSAADRRPTRARPPTDGPPGPAADPDADLIAAGRLWLRRLYTAPGSGELVALASRARRVPRGLAQHVVARDQSCRTPWCDAPIRHTDHVVAFAAGGRTEAANLQGLCERCNYAKQAPGWRAGPAPGRPGERHSVIVRTPTGDLYPSTAPPLPGAEPPGGRHGDSPGSSDVYVGGVTGARAGPVRERDPGGQRPSVVEAHYSRLVLIA